MASERGPDDERDHAWLLARARGEPGPTISVARAGQYAQLETLIADLPAVPAGTVQRRGWEQDVLAVIDAEVGQPADRSAAPATAVSPSSRKPTARKNRRRTVAAVAAAFAMVAGVAIVVFRQRDQIPAEPIAGGHDLHVAATGGQGAVIGEITRGMHVERGPLGFDHALEVRGSTTPVFRELRDGDTLVTGDRIRASVTTSSEAYLYLAFCADQHLQMYPSQRGVRTRAGQRTVVPEGGGELVLDAHPGTEVLYLIVSRAELSQADPHLASLVVGDGGRPVACDASVDIGLVKPWTEPHSNVLRGERIPKRAPPPRADGRGSAGPPGDAVWSAADGSVGPGTVITADEDGIAIVRYRFRHDLPESVGGH
jgi:hypothetical protein